MVRIYYTIFESISHEEEKEDEFNGFKRFNRFTGLAPGAYRPLIGDERGGAGSMGSTGSRAAYFVILSGEKRRMLNNGLSEI